MRNFLLLNLKKTTPDELDKRMADAYGVTGETRDRAIRFFVGGVKYLGLEISPLIAGKKTNGGTRKRGPRRQTPPPFNPASTPPGNSGTSKTVRLQSGGTLTLSATLDLFSLNSEDRAFVFGFIDKLDGYNQPESKTEGAE